MSAIKNYIHDKCVKWCDEYNLNGFDAEVITLATACMSNVQECTIEKALKIVEESITQKAKEDNVTLEDALECLYHDLEWSNRYERMIDNG